MLLKRLLILNFRIFIITSSDKLTFEQYDILQSVSKLDYEAHYKKYLAVIMKPLFGAWSIESYNYVEKNCGRVRVARLNWIVSFFFENLKRLNMNLK